MHRSSFFHASCLLLALTLAGCGEMVFKRGADPGSMASTQSVCRTKTDSETAYIACMEDQGYVVKGSQESVFVGGSDAGDAAAATGSVAPSFFVEGSKAAPVAPSVAPRAVQPTPAAPPAVPVSPPPPVVSAVDPLELVDVASWWKLGGSASGLEAAQAACVATLGNAHRPVPDSTQVTRAMIGCLRDAGWRGMGR